MNLIDEVLALYSKYSKDKVMKAIYMNGLLTLVLAFNSTYCFNSVNNRIKKPVYTLLKELKDMDLIDRSLAREIGLSKKDEISVMAS